MCELFFHYEIKEGGKVHKVSPAFPPLSNRYPSLLGSLHGGALAVGALAALVGGGAYAVLSLEAPLKATPSLEAPSLELPSSEAPLYATQFLVSLL